MTHEDELHHDLGWLLWRLQRAAYAAELRALEPHGLSVWAYAVLSTVVHEPATSQLALAGTVGVDRTKMVTLVDELEAAGLVKRRPDPADRRARLVEPTDAGRKTLRAARADIRRAEQQLLAALPASEREPLRTQLRTLASAQEAPR